jgi:hypothetical protein
MGNLYHAMSEEPAQVQLVEPARRIGQQTIDARRGRR